MMLFYYYFIAFCKFDCYTFYKLDINFFRLQCLSAIQYHSGWAYSENVNVLSAGYNKPEFGSIGSGIYLGIDMIYLIFHFCLKYLFLTFNFTY